MTENNELVNFEINDYILLIFKKAPLIAFKN